MKIIVLKFGGTSVGSLERIKKVANIIASYKKKKFSVKKSLELFPRNRNPYG